MQALTAGIVNLVPEGLILLDQPDGGGVGVQGRAARRAGAAVERGRVAGVRRHRLHRQDRDADGADARASSSWSPRAASTSRRWRRRSRPTPPARRQRNSTLQAIADAGLAEAGRGAGSSGRCRSRRGGAGARSTSATSGSCSARPERFAAADPALLERAREEADEGGACWPSAGRRRRSRPARPSPPFPPACRRSGLVVLAERLRPNAPTTVAFFVEQDVDAQGAVRRRARDRGGDRPRRRRARGPRRPSTARRSRPTRALREAVLAAPAVGRISPDGKRAVVEALNDAGRYVAMVGDGVNDVPALKAARLAIAQGSGVADGPLGRRPRPRPRRLRRRARGWSPRAARSSATSSASHSSS